MVIVVYNKVIFHSKGHLLFKLFQLSNQFYALLNCTFFRDMYTVYVLYSENHNKHYTGYTSNFENRLKAHNELGTKGFTVKYRPWQLIYKREFELKSEAMTHENWLKSGAGRTFVHNLKH